MSQRHLAIVHRRFAAALAAFACAGWAAAAENPPLMDESSDLRRPPLMSEDGPRDLTDPVDDLRIGATLSATPDVSETVHVHNGTYAHYDWEGHRATGAGPELSYLAQLNPGRHWWNGLLVGAEVQYTYFNTTPASYGVNGGVVPNTAGYALTMQFANADAVLGWCFGPWHTRFGGVDIELLAVAGGGMVWGDTEGFNAANQPAKVRGFGSSWNLGPRLGVDVDDDDWVFGLHVDWVYTRGHVDINEPNGDHSRLVERRSAPAGTVEIGYRF
jgi:opacity protein-like surface antigen